jgi:Transport protein particle (TRAPP) component
VHVSTEKSRLDRNLAWFMLQFACGLIRGALATLAQPATIKADFWDEKTDRSLLPAVSFTIRLKQG